MSCHNLFDYDFTACVNSRKPKTKVPTVLQGLPPHD